MVSPPEVAAGEYKVELDVGDEILESKALIKPDPEFVMLEQERALKIEKQVEVMVLSRKIGLVVTGVKSIRRQLEKIYEGKPEEKSFPQPVKKALEGFEEKFIILEEDIIPRGFGYRGSLEYALRGGSLSHMTLKLALSIGRYPSRPTETDLFMLEQLTEAVKEVVACMNSLIDDDIPGLNKVLEQYQLKTLRAPKKIEF